MNTTMSPSQVVPAPPVPPKAASKAGAPATRAGALPAGGTPVQMRNTRWGKWPTGTSKTGFVPMKFEEVRGGPIPRRARAGVHLVANLMERRAGWPSW